MSQYKTKIITCLFFLSLLMFFNLSFYVFANAEEYILTASQLNAKYCALIDGESGRLLFGKDCDTEVPMASTTKIMTCLIALSMQPLDYVMTTSEYAASMPDVQLNAKKGEQFHLSDLLYSLMLKSHNDTAVIIAENYAFHYLCTNPDQIKNNDFIQYDLSFLSDDILSSNDSAVISQLSKEQSQTLVKIFANFMNQKAKEFGCCHTYYITPNGLDCTDENGEHRTTAYELALVMSKCIQNIDFNKICQTSTYSFCDATGKYTYSVANSNAFLKMYDNIIAGKTGFTDNAGYCYVCAYQSDGRTFIVALLACGWPSNKSYKWKDSRLLLNYAISNYYKKEIVSPGILSKNISVKNGEQKVTGIGIFEPLNMLISDSDCVNILYNLPDYIYAPVYENTHIGDAYIYINDQLIKTIPIRCTSDINKNDFINHFLFILKKFTFVQLS